MSGFTPELVLWEENINPGAHWSGVLRRGNTLRITALNDNANLSATFLNYEQPIERYNMADTLKAQHTGYLTKGHVCYSDMGRVMCSITEDTCGWHDTMCGVSNAELVRNKYGETSFQEDRNLFYKNGQDSLLVELGKYGLGKRDLSSTINLFSKIVVDDDGKLTFVKGNSLHGDFLEMRFEMNCLVVLSTCPHPLDPNTQYSPSGVQLMAWRSGVVPPDDPCLNACEENQRGFYNTEVYYR